MRVLRQLLHPRLRTKLIIGAVLAACVAMALQFVISTSRVDSNLQGLEEKRLAEDLDVAGNAIEQMQMDLEKAAAGQGAGEDLIAAVERRDADYIAEHVTSWIKTVFEAQNVTVLDADGNVIDFVGPPLDDLGGESVVQRTLKGVVSAEFVYRDGRLWMMAAAPIMPGGSQGESNGTLVLAEPIDDRFARAITAITNTQITIFLKDRAAAASDREISGSLEAAEAAQRLRDATAVVRVGQHATQAVSLGVPGADAYLAVSSARAPITTAQSALRRSMLWSLVPAIALATLVAVFLSMQLGRPLRSLRGAVNAIAFGDLEQRVKVGGDDEIADLGRAFNAMAERVSVAQETLRRAAVRDSLTGLLNHREFYRRLTDEIARCERGTMPVSVMMIDLDHFKDVNDSYGHLRGDTVLREVASLITRCVREEDVVARYAGDEFAVILPGVAEATAMRVADRLMSGAERVAIAADLPGDRPVTLSIGVACRWPGEWTPTRTVELADEALYRAKDGGRNRVVVSDDVTV
jgi:diguanylate cyclase (GGDEF)-like protein